jgi:uncharacterized repeat protein (TIGR04138 family)
MQPANFEDALEHIAQQDARYHRDAYLFLREALNHTQKSLGQSRKVEPRHVTGQELLAGVREYALSQYGPMTKTVLGEWGIHRCEDIGEMVFIMVDHGLLSKTETDNREDFKGGFDFDEAFCQPFRPRSQAKTSHPSTAPANQESRNRE